MYILKKPKAYACNYILLPSFLQFRLQEIIPNRFKLITFIQISEYQQFMILYFATNNNFVHVKVLVMLRNHQPVMRCTPCVHRVTQGEEMDAM